MKTDTKPVAPANSVNEANRSSATTDAVDASPLSAELVQRFCGVAHNEIRDYLCKPWRKDGLIYATNGHVLIEFDDDGREAVDWSPSHPLGDKIFVKYPAREFVPMPALGAIRSKHRCARCCGKGFHFVVDCDDCDGFGGFEHGRHKYDCAECNGKGSLGSETIKTVCLFCDGFGEDGSWRGEEFVIGEAGFQARYMRLIALLPNVEIAPADRLAGSHFRFTGGRGMVMPMRAKPAGVEGLTAAASESEPKHSDQMNEKNSA